MQTSELSSYLSEYCARRGLKWPTTEEALLWLASEVGEACDLHLMRPGFEWVRNNPYVGKGWSAQAFAEELGDVIFMAMVAGMREGLDPLEAMLKKMKRKLDEHERK